MSDHHNRYKEAGVDPELAGSLIRTLMKDTDTDGPLPSGFFCRLVPLPDWMMTKPGSYLAIGTDGVGTKLMLGAQTGLLDGIGQDLVGMVYNDLITCGGQPFAFLDYYATGRIDPPVYEAVIGSIRRACEACDMPLLGGETAEMPGLYGAGDFDLAGFGIAAVQERDILRPDHTAPGDQLVGFPATGFHSNGYSLIRKVVTDAAVNMDDLHRFNQTEAPLKEWLMRPTRLYVDVIEAIRAKDIEVISLAHITGGGYFENLPRSLATGCGAVLRRTAFNAPSCDLFHWFADVASMSLEEMLATFNNGYGLVAVCRPAAVEAICTQFPDAQVLGEVVADDAQSIGLD
jgi:phosphoribosylformylglycinamidine cyclo-ligase